MADQRRKTPVGGVRAADDDLWLDEEPTGVGDPLDRLNARSKNTSRAAKAAFGAISDLRQTMKVAVEQDQKDHALIYNSMDDVKSRVEKLDVKVDKTGDKVDALAGHVGDLREESARTGAHVERLVAKMEVKEKAEIQADIHIKTVRAETGIKEEASRKKLKRQLFFKFAVPIVTAVATAIATAISAYLITR